MKTKTLNEFSEGNSAKIVELIGNPHLRQRLLDMGITKGRVVRIERTSVLGSPLIIQLMDYFLILGKEESDSILAEQIG